MLLPSLCVFELIPLSCSKPFLKVWWRAQMLDLTQASFQSPRGLEDSLQYASPNLCSDHGFMKQVRFDKLMSFHDTFAWIFHHDIFECLPWKKTERESPKVDLIKCFCMFASSLIRMEIH